MNAIPQTSGWHAGFMKLLPVVQTHAKIKFRKLRAEQREVAIQETIAAACMHYQLAAAQGKLHAVRPGSLADFAVRYVRTGRHVGGVQDRSKDVLSPNCHRRYGVKLQGYPAQSCDGTVGCDLIFKQPSLQIEASGSKPPDAAWNLGSSTVTGPHF